jgi:hypothetical protein
MAQVPFLEVRSFSAEEAGLSQSGLETPASASPFLALYVTDGEAEAMSPEAEEFGAFLNELYDEEFDEALFELVSEAAALYENQFESESGEGGAIGSEAQRLLSQHFAPLVRESEALVGSLASELGRRPPAGVTDGEVQALVDRYHPAAEFSPSFENFFGKLKKAFGKVASKAVALAKKGASVATTMGLVPFFDNLKALVEPMLMRVLRVAINKLPASLQPAARKLAERYSLLKKPAQGPGSEPGTAPASGGAITPDTPAAADSAATSDTTPAADSTATSDNAAAADVGDIQQEFHQRIASLLFAPSAVEQDLEVVRAGTEAQAPVPDALGDLDRARVQFVDNLDRLREGEDPTPHVERFIPAILPVLRVGLRLAGRKRVVGFLAKLLAKVIQRFVGPQYAPALSQAIGDAGLRLIGLETSPEDEARTAGDAVAATVEEAVRRVAALPDYILDDREFLEGFALEAVEQAAAANLPPALSEAAYRKRPDLMEARSLRGTWLPMPLRRRRKRYKKYSRVISTRLTPHAASALESFGGAALADILEEQFGLPPGEDVEARIHLYETVPGTLLSEVARLERDTPGLGSSDAYVQLHPLTPQAAGLLCGEPRLGREVDPHYLTNPYTADVGQRFYYLEVSGKRPLMTTGPDGRARPRRRSRVRLTLDFRGNQIRVSLYLSEVRAQELAVKLRQRVHLGAVMTSLGRILERGIQTALARGLGRVKIIHEALIPGEWSDALRRLPSLVPRVLAGRLQEWVLRAIADHLRQHAQQFLTAADDQREGVTLHVIVAMPPGFAQLGQALRGKAFALGALSLSGVTPALSAQITSGYGHE